MINKELEKNLNAIRKYDEKLCDEIVDFSLDNSSVALVQTKTGEYNLFYRDTFIHSNEGATKESDLIVSKIENIKEDNAIRIIYGLGLGYLPESFSNAIGKAKIIIYEPNLDILKYVLSIAQIDSLYKDNVFICNNSHTLSHLVTKYVKPDSCLTISFLSSYKKLFFDDINRIFTIAQKAQGSVIANKNTYLNKAPKALINTFKNLKTIFKNPNISDLADIYKGKTALCISAGPSLRDNIEIIKNNQDKFVIFAVNPVIKLLSSYNIKPDFIVDIEAMDTKPQFNSINPCDYYFILEGFSNPSVHGLDTKKSFNYLSNDNFMNLWVRDCFHLKDNIKTLGTVSYTAMASAFIMGCKRIILIGQDLAYKDGKCYAQGSQFGDLECIYDEKEKRYKIVAKDINSYAKSFVSDSVDLEKSKILANLRIDFLNKNIYTVKSQDGREIPTETGYALFIEWFEEAAKKFKELNPQIELINSSIGGAQIDGWENIALSSIVENLAHIEKLDLKDYSSNLDKKYIQNKIQILEKKIIDFKLLVEEYTLICEKLLKELQIKRTITFNAQKLIEKFEYVFARLVNSKKDFEFNFISIVYIYNCANLYHKLDYKNLSTLEEIINYNKTILVHLNTFLKGLSDCKPVVFE